MLRMCFGHAWHGRGRCMEGLKSAQTVMGTPDETSCGNLSKYTPEALCELPLLLRQPEEPDKWSTVYPH